MLDERFIGEITAVSAKIKTIKGEDGTKMKQGFYTVTLESADIDYDSISKFNPYISATLLNIQPMPMKAVSFGEQAIMNLAVAFYDEDEEMAKDETLAEFGDLFIKNLSVKVKENIPIYSFKLEIPMHYDGKFLFRALKSKVSFEFRKMEK